MLTLLKDNRQIQPPPLVTAVVASPRRRGAIGRIPRTVRGAGPIPSGRTIHGRQRGRSTIGGEGRSAVAVRAAVARPSGGREGERERERG